MPKKCFLSFSVQSINGFELILVTLFKVLEFYGIGLVMNRTSIEVLVHGDYALSATLEQPSSQRQDLPTYHKSFLAFKTP